MRADLDAWKNASAGNFAQKGRELLSREFLNVVKQIYAKYQDSIFSCNDIVEEMSK